MGSKLSKFGDSTKRLKITVKHKVKGIFSKSKGKLMVEHAQVLIEALKLGPLRVKVRKHHFMEEIVENNSENVSNLDVVSGMGTAGDGRTLLTDADRFGEEYSDEGLAEEMDHLPPPIPGTTPSKAAARQKSVVSLAGKLVGKLKAEYKYVNLFEYRVRNRAGAVKGNYLLNHALEAHQAIVDISNQMENLFETAAKQTMAKKGKLKLAQEMIVPGTKLKGFISIPPQSFTEETENEEGHRQENIDPNFGNMQQDQQRPYELMILRDVKDEVGDTYWLGRHQTYDGRRDKQTVLIQFSKENEQAIHFEDYETHCDGQIYESQNKLEGSVKQLKKGRPGFFVATRGEDFRFELLRSEESKFDQANVLRGKMFQARFARALAFGAWCGVANNGRITGEKFTGKVVDWSEVIEDMVWVCDEVGTLMRRYVSLLNDLKFETAAARKKQLEELEAQGIRRGKIHQVWDACTILLQRVRDNIPSGSVHGEQSLPIANSFAEKVLRRLEPVYGRFDQSMRKAEVRVCEGYKKEWLQTYKSEIAPQLDSRSLSSANSKRLEEVMDIKREPALRRKKTSKESFIPSNLNTDPLNNDEVFCTICTAGFEIGEEMYVTPCAHAFHTDCLEGWFKEASVCPICRQDFSQADDC